MDSFVFFPFLFHVCPSMWCVFLTWAHDRSSHQFHTTSQADPPAYRLALPCSSFNNRRIERVTRPFLFFLLLARQSRNNRTTTAPKQPNIMKEREKKNNNKKALWVVEYIYSTYKCSCMYMAHKHWPCVLHMFGRWWPSCQSCFFCCLSITKMALYIVNGIWSPWLIGCSFNIHSTAPL